MRAVSRLILSAVILILTGLLAAVAMYLPDFFFSFYTDFSKQALNAVSSVTGAFPFAVWEVGLVVLVLLALSFPGCPAWSCWPACWCLRSQPCGD